MTGPDVLDDQIWQDMVTRGRLNTYEVRFFESLASTSTHARELAEQGAGAGLLVVANGQHSGRGRLGRSFFSPTGSGLYFSQLHEPLLPAEHVPKMTLAAGLAVAIAIDKISGGQTKIKWPNDLLLNRRKVGGILAESVFVPGAGRLMVILGIGINVFTPQQAFGDDLAKRASSLTVETGGPVPRGALLLEIVQQLEQIFQHLYARGFEEILAAWRQRDATLNKTLRWVTPVGDVIQGVSLGPDVDGQLRVRDRQGQVHHVLSGDITLGTTHSV